MERKKMGVRQVTFILNPAFALVSMNMTLSSRAFASPSSIETCLQIRTEKIIGKAKQSKFQTTYNAHET